jgi:hypothetical protein
MATLEIEPFGRSSLDAIFNVDFRVGVGGPNKVDDVRLVQVFLHFIYKPGEQDIPDSIADIMPLRPDGICGNKTKRTILAFQRDTGHRFANDIFPDGNVDHVTLPRSKGALHGKFFTILALNAVSKVRDPISHNLILSLGPRTMAAAILAPKRL